MILIKTTPETKDYLPRAINVLWIKTASGAHERYRLEALSEAPAINMSAGCWKRELVRPEDFAFAGLSLLESGAVLASFPLLGKLPGSIASNPYTVWFLLDAPALIPAGIFGKEIEIEAGRHLMASSLGQWVVFFKPKK